jgi:hypothetical protein
MLLNNQFLPLVPSSYILTLLVRLIFSTIRKNINNFLVNKYCLNWSFSYFFDFFSDNCAAFRDLGHGNAKSSRQERKYTRPYEYRSGCFVQLCTVVPCLTFSHYPLISTVPFIPLFLQGYIHLKMCPGAGAVGE